MLCNCFNKLLFLPIKFIAELFFCDFCQSRYNLFVKNQQIGEEVAKVQLCPRGESTALIKEDKLNGKYELL